MPLSATHLQTRNQSAKPSEPPHGPVLLCTEGLKKAFGGQVVLDGLDLELRQGEVVLLRGENGSGKTTLLNILTGNLEPDAGTIHYLADDTPRTYHFPRPWWRELNPFDHFTPEFVAREGVGRTWQEIRLFGSQTLRENIALAEPGHPGENPLIALFAAGFSNRRETEINQKAEAMLARLGLAGKEDASADKISLGQAKRVAIARAVAAGARILFLDEPLAGLDRQGIQDVLDLLEALGREHQLTMVIVEHLFNQPHLRGLVTTDWLLQNGTIQQAGKEKGTFPAYLRSSEQSRPPWFDLMVTEDAEIVDERLSRGALLTRIRHPKVLQDPLAPVLELHKLVVRRGTRTVIGLDDHGNETGLSLTLHEGEYVILQAPNGWGKSTLFSAIAGLLPIQGGAIELKGQPLDGLPTWIRVQRGLRLLLSDHYIFPGLSVRESLKLSGIDDSATALEDLFERDSASLSGGERRRLALAGLQSGIIALCDEPFDALDEMKTRDAVTNLLSRQRTLFIAIPYGKA